VFLHRLSRFEQQILTIHPGEFYATGDDVVISTVLGSCVAVGLYDPGAGMGGLNHFMLPGVMKKDELIANPNARYGMHAMELLINELMKLGLRKRDMVAKVFGGGSVLRLHGTEASAIPRSNIEFAFEYLEKESIPVVASDVGGRQPRKIFFFPRSGKVLLTRIGGQRAGVVEKEEEEYLEAIRRAPREGPIRMFK